MINKIKNKANNQIDKFIILTNLKRSLKLNQDYLKNGKYLFSLKVKPILYLDNKNTRKFLDSASRANISDFRANIWKIINLVFNVKITSENKNTYNGELLMLDRNGNIKIFNFENNYTYTKMKDFKEYKKIYEVNQKMKDIYNLTFINFDDKNQTITEKYIDFKKLSNWKNEEFNLAISEVSEGIKKTLGNAQPIVFQNLKDLVEEFKTKEINKELVKLVLDLMPKNIEDEVFRVIRIHGDMNFNNVLLSNKTFYYIDWDESVDAVFFYDFINIIFADWAETREIYFIKKYLDGKYDDLLKSIFSYSNQSYDKSKKKLYLAVYVMNRYLMFDNSSDTRITKESDSLFINALNDLKLYNYI